MASFDGTYGDRSVSIVSECTIVPSSESPIASLRLTASDLPRLSIHYMQTGCLFPGHPPASFLAHLKLSLSKALSIFPPLAGRLSTDPATGHVSIACSDAGALFVHALAPSILLSHILDPADVPVALTYRFFALCDNVAYDSHSDSVPLVAVQVTELADGVFIGCSISHGVADGTTFWHFFNTFAEISRGATKISNPPSFSRDRSSPLYTDAVLQLPGGQPPLPILSGKPVRERIFHFSRQSVLAVKKRANESFKLVNSDLDSNFTGSNPDDEISSYQSVCAQVWRSVTRARILPSNKTTTFLLPGNIRPRVNPQLDSFYFGNAVQTIKTTALAGEIVSRELGWSANLLRRTVRAYDEKAVRKGIEEWERDPKCVQEVDLDEGTMVIGNSPRFEMYNSDFGWARPVAVRSGMTYKCDGKFDAHSGREGGGSMELEVVLAPETMARLEKDDEFMQYVT